jgi:hypothetical protein
MSIVRYCPYLAAESYVRKVVQDNAHLVTVVTAMIAWIAILLSVAACVSAAQASDAARAEAEAEAEAEKEDEEDFYDSCYLEDTVESLVREVASLKEQLSALKASPRKPIGMKLVYGNHGKFEEDVMKAVNDGWEISSEPMQIGPSTSYWCQPLLRYKTEPVEPVEEIDTSFVPPALPEMQFDEIAPKIRKYLLDLRINNSSVNPCSTKQIAEAVSVSGRTINSALYTMMSKGLVKKRVSNGSHTWTLAIW